MEEVPRTFTDYNPTNQLFQNLFRNRATLVRTGTNSYELRYPDGSKKIFDQPDNSIGTARKIFMSALVDPAGNAATIQFDQPGRITSITDAIGQTTRFYYDLPMTNEFIHPSVAWVPPFILTRVVDPFGRTATFFYGSSINARLASITDAIGMTSSFLYDYVPGKPDLGMTNLITPYGTTMFSRGSLPGTLSRQLGGDYPSQRREGTRRVFGKNAGQYLQHRTLEHRAQGNSGSKFHLVGPQYVPLGPPGIR